MGTTLKFLSENTVRKCTFGEAYLVHYDAMKKYAPDKIFKKLSPICDPYNFNKKLSRIFWLSVELEDDKENKE